MPRQLDPYLHLNGNCAQAVKFYEQALGAKVEMLSTFGQSPMGEKMPPEYGDRIMHAKLTFDGQVLMASDTPPGSPANPLSGFSLSLNYPTVSAATQAFQLLAEGGTVQMPLDKTFWAAAFGMVTDRFGVPWMLGCEKEE
jgi:PhnB protein